MEQQQNQGLAKPVRGESKKYSDHSSDPIFRNFINSIRSPITKKSYTQSLNRYYLSRPENINLTLHQIISKNPKTIEYELLDIIYEMKEKQGLSYSTIHSTLASIVHFFEINDVSINKRKLNKFKGENIAKFEYRSYTHEEINTILSWVDERGKASVLLMASTGMRVGALPDIKLKHLRRWNINNDNSGSGLAQYVYQITVYANSPNHKYRTFCTPEAAKIIDEYLEFRKRHGDNIRRDPITGNWLPGESSLFVRNFNTEQQMLLNLSISAKFSISIVPKTFTRAIIKALEQLGKRDRLKLVEEQGSTDYEKRSSYAKHKNEIHPCHSLRIFAVTQMQRAKVDKTIREMLIGHSTGLDKAYYKPQDEEVLEEYQKAIEALTISNEDRLKKQIFKYRRRSKGLEEMSQQLNDSYDQKFQLLKDDMENKIQQILLKVNVENLRKEQ